ncbi:hypothetical protein HYS99_00590 [Candidatus Giovannonibacteria bacterium]|nr:hypothetical protein [Candidatus Giovannonibacteria bacterium]
MKIFNLKSITAFLIAFILSTNIFLPNIVFAETEVSPDELMDPFAGQDLSGGAGDSGLGSIPGIGGLLSGALRTNLVPISMQQDIPGTARDIANKIAWGIAKMMIHQLTQQIVQLIRTGGQGGGALFVQDWQGFLLDAADQASGVFLQELNLTQLCQPFGIKLRLLFADDSARLPLQRRLSCTVSTVARNIQGFLDDFNNGGWARWFEITQVPQNNFYGAYLIALDDKLTREANAVAAARNEAISANGFIGVKECEPTVETEPGDAPIGEVCKIVSPGKYLENRLAEATTDDIRQLGLADSFNEILIAAFQSLINNLFFSQGGLASSNIRSSTIRNQLQEDLFTVKQSGLQLSGIDSAIAATKAIINKKQNSLAKINEALDALGNLKTCLQDGGKTLASANTDINSATTVKTSLENDLLDQNILLINLEDDKFDMTNASTVATLNDALSKAYENVSEVGSYAIAAAENSQITTIRTKAVSDLTSCENSN